MKKQLGSARVALVALSQILLLSTFPACEVVVDAQIQASIDAGTGANKGTGGSQVSQAGTGGTNSGSGGTFSGTGGAGTGGSSTGGSGSGGAGTGGSDGTGGLRATGTGGGSGGAAFGGAPGSGGQMSRTDGGVPQDGAGGPTDSGSSAPTWTEIYTTLLNSASYTSNCTGSACHNPGTQKNIRLSTSALGYTSIRGLVTPGSATAGTLIRDLTSGSMPQGRPKMPTADLDRIKAWIVAGALNN